MTREVVLAGDLGGTKTLLALVTPGEPLDLIARARFESARFGSLESMVEEFLEGRGVRPTCAVFGVAGPVIEGRAQLTNLTYAVDERALASTLGIEPVRLLNDLEATAFALPRLPRSAFTALCAGRGRERGDFAVVSVGTGLGEALGVDLGDSYTVVAGEGGHVDFAPYDARSAELLSYLWAAQSGGHVSKEAVLSGDGIAALFGFVVDSGLAKPVLDPSAEGDVNVAITRAGLEGRCPAAKLALELFAVHLGAHAGDVALRSLPRGGVYLAGGIPPRLAPVLKSSAFRDAFVNKGRFADELRDIRVEIVTERDAPLLGAAHVAFSEHTRSRRTRLQWPGAGDA
jgi:glucokinase